MALCLKRRYGQTLLIGDGAARVEVEVRKLTPGYVVLAVRAPRSVPVLRGEIAGEVVRTFWGAVNIEERAD